MRIHNLLLSTAFIALILGMAGVAALRSLPYAAPPGTDVVRGGLTRVFEAHYDKVFPVKTYGTNLWAAIQYALFGEGRDGVVIGREGWLYTSEEFRAGSDADERIHANLARIAQVQQTLRQRGTELVVALLPAKARLYPEYLADEQPAALHRDLYARIRSGLDAQGVRTPDLLAALARCKAQAPVFLRTDTHWTPEGARCSAQALAAVVAAPGTARAQSFVTQTETLRSHQGDLMQFLPLAPHFAALLPQPDLLRPSSTQALGGDLLADAPAPRVVLIGTSYSADERWNFDGALREALAEDVLNLAEAGHGPFEPMLAYLGQASHGEPPARLIWEIPERYIPAGPAPAPPEAGLQVAQAAALPQHSNPKKEDSP